VAGRSLVQRSPTECGVPECDREALIMRRPWPTAGCRGHEKKVLKLEQCYAYTDYQIHVKTKRNL
jgi:hypothetical protein